MKFFVWLKDRGIKSPELRRFLESHPEWFARCDAEGTENPQGHFWAVRREVLAHEHEDSADRHRTEATCKETA